MKPYDAVLDEIKRARERQMLLDRIAVLEDRVSVLAAECKRLADELARKSE